MKLRKDKWKLVKLEDICEINPSKRELAEIPNDTLVSFAEMADLNEKRPYFNFSKTSNLGVLKKGGLCYFKDADVLLAKMTPCFENGKSGLVAGCLNGIGFGSTEFFVLRGVKIDPYLLYSIISSDFFIDSGKLMMLGTTGRKRLMKNFVANYQIPLPPLEEQKQIAALFQSIDTAIEQVEGQEKNLKALWQRLIDDFVSQNPKFGDLIINKEMKSLRFSEVTEKITRRIDPFTKGIKRRIGGEDFISSDLKLRTWGEVGKDYVGPAFHMHVLPGDILYVSRNSHLRKVAYADFEGVCSNTTYVVQSNEKQVLQHLMKHIMLSECFTKYAMSVTKGSTNPYLNWKDLDNFSFQIPDLETQKEIANVLDGILEIVEQLKQQKTSLNHLKQKLLNEILG